MFDNAIKMANLMNEEQKILREAGKTSLSGSSLSGSCDLAAGSDFTFGLTASTSSIEHPQRNRDGGVFFCYRHQQPVLD